VKPTGPHSICPRRGGIGRWFPHRVLFAKFAMFYLAEYINMTTVSALAATLFFGGWHAPWPLNMWAGANSGWWPVLWFTAKVWVFLFGYFWLRATLPRLRYDQFMALGWKVLIPVSLVWVMIAAVIRTLRDQGYAHWTALLVIASIVVSAGLLPIMRKPFSGKLTRQQVRREAPVGNVLPETAFRHHRCRARCWCQ